MKTFIVITAISLLAGCGSMRMQSGSSGSSSSAPSSSWGYDSDDRQRDRIFNSWVGGA